MLSSYGCKSTRDGARKEWELSERGGNSKGNVDVAEEKEEMRRNEGRRRERGGTGERGGWRRCFSHHNRKFLLRERQERDHGREGEQLGEKEKDGERERERERNYEGRQEERRKIQEIEREHLREREIAEEQSRGRERERE